MKNKLKPDESQIAVKELLKLFVKFLEETSKFEQGKINNKRKERERKASLLKNEDDLRKIQLTHQSQLRTSKNFSLLAYFLIVMFLASFICLIFY